MKLILVCMDKFLAIGFNEFNDKDNLVLFNFRESERDVKETPIILFHHIIPKV